MKQKFLLKTMLLLCALLAGVSSAWADDYALVTSAPNDWSGDYVVVSALDQSASTFIADGSVTGNNFSTANGVKTLTNASITYDDTNKKLTGVTDSYVLHIGPSTNTGKYYITLKGAASTIYLIANSTTGSSSISSATVTTNAEWTLSLGTSGNAYLVGKSGRYVGWNSSYFRAYAASNKDTYKCYLFKKVESAPSGPSITADDVNIAYDATEGSIGYSVQNSTGNVGASITTGDWLTLGTITASEVPFTCSANTATTPRTAKVTLSFTDADDKIVTVTQAGRPNYISEITAASTAYTIIGTVVATNSRGFVIGDGTGYVYYYKGSDPTQAINDKVKISGTTGTYGQIIQFTSNAIVTTETSSAYDGTPAATVINAVPDYSDGLHLSTYLQFEGTLKKSSDNYLISVGGENIQISYPTTAQGTALTALDGKTVRVKGYFSGINSSSNFTVMLESVEEVTTPTLSANPATATAFTYIVGNGPSDDQMFTITGTNLVSSDITAAVSSDYEITDNTDYSSSVTVASGDIVSVRLKAGLAKGAHNGTLTLSSTDADDVVINLSGSVTGQTYAIEQYTAPATAHGTITFSPASPIEDGTEVTLSAEPSEGYDFTSDSWVIYKQSGEDYVVDNSITVTANKFMMPAYAIWVDGTFTAKPTYAITCVASPVAGGELISDLDNAYDGQTVTLSYSENTGYELTGIVITKTSDGSATGITPAISGDDYTFTMPGYAVTATATFESTTFDGSFAKVTSISALEDGAYYVLYSTKAMNSTVTSGKMGATAVTINNDVIENPDKSIVWKLVKNGDNWDLYSEKEEKYCYIEGTNTSAFKMADAASCHFAVTAYATGGGFKFKTTHSSGRGINYGNNDFGSYADSNSPTVYLYKYTTLTERTITFDGNGGTYNTATTYTQTVYDGVEATLDANQFTRSGYEFIGWNTNANGENGTEYAAGAKITVTGSDLTLYAQWSPLYTLTIDNNIDGGSVEIEGNVTSAIEGAEIELSSTPNAGHKFADWNVYKAGDPSTTVEVNNNKFTMPNYNVIISATFEEVQTYTLITDISQLVPGKHYIIASGADGSIKAMGSQNSSHYRNVVSVTASSGIIPETDGVYEFVIYGPNANGYYTIYDAQYNSNAGGYLYANTSSSNQMETQASNDANGKWNIEIANTGAATINAQGTNTRNRMRFNGDRFACYASNTSVSALPYLYVKDGDTPVTTTANVKLNAYGYATFASTSTLDFLDADADGVEYGAWEITGVTGNVIDFNQIKSTVAAGKGILLKGTPNATISLNILPVGGDALSSNKLVGITAATDVTADEYFGLKGNKFVKVNAGTVPAGKALLPASVVAGARELTFDFGGETNGVAEVRSQMDDIRGSVYNLNGQKVVKPGKGMYIMNGRKVIVK